VTNYIITELVAYAFVGSQSVCFW